MKERPMRRSSWLIAISPLVLMAMSMPSLGDDAERPKATLKNPDLHEGIKVKWVYEGCAAYPVEIDEVAEEAVPGSVVTEPNTNLATKSVQKRL